MADTEPTTAERNKALMKKIFDGIATGDATLFYESMAEDAVMTITGQYSWSRVFKGKNSIARDLYGYVHSCMRQGQRGRTEAFHYLADGDWVVIEAKGRMVTKDGLPYENDYCLFYRLAEGKIVEMKEYQDSTLCERLLGPYPQPARPEGY